MAKLYCKMEMYQKMDKISEKLSSVEKQNSILLSNLLEKQVTSTPENSIQSSQELGSCRGILFYINIFFSREATLGLALSVVCPSVHLSVHDTSSFIKCQNQGSKSGIKIKQQTQVSKSSVKLSIKIKCHQ